MKAYPSQLGILGLQAGEEVNHYALGEFFDNQNVTHILGKGWYRNPKAKPQRVPMG